MTYEIFCREMSESEWHGYGWFGTFDKATRHVEMIRNTFAAVRMNLTVEYRIMHLGYVLHQEGRL